MTTTPIEIEGGLLGAGTAPYTPRIRAVTNHTRTARPRPKHSTLEIEMRLMSYEVSWTRKRILIEREREPDSNRDLLQSLEEYAMVRFGAGGGVGMGGCKGGIALV